MYGMSSVILELMVKILKSDLSGGYVITGLSKSTKSISILHLSKSMLRERQSPFLHLLPFQTSIFYNPVYEIVNNHSSSKIKENIQILNNFRERKILSTESN
jgi:hypothetical protein